MSRQEKLAIFLIIVQLIIIIIKISEGTIQETFQDIGYIIGFYICGIVGIITLVKERKKAKEKLLKNKAL